MLDPLINTLPNFSEHKFSRPDLIMTKRPQNWCKTCEYTWYPRGGTLSAKCPSCGGRDVDVDLRAARNWAWVLCMAGMGLFLASQGYIQIPPLNDPAPIEYNKNN